MSNTTNTYPLDEPHLQALRWACALDEPINMNTVVTALQAYYIRAIHRPDVAASLVRDLLARAGVDVHEHSEPDWDGECDKEIVVRALGDAVYVEDFDASWPVADVPRLISALANLAPGDREGAMRALREVGR